MMAKDEGPGRQESASDDEAALEAAMEQVPRGAIALAGTSVALLMLCWFLIYLLVFLPRGSVG
jgi:hypothetical protein